MSQLNADQCYIFTDTETTGLDINFSQIIQIGSILTDESLNQENSQDIGCKLLPWIIPSPDAYLVHKKIESLSEKKLRVGFIGRFLFEKGLNDFIQVVFLVITICLIYSPNFEIRLGK